MDAKKYHSYSREDLDALPTRVLISIRKQSYVVITAAEGENLDHEAVKFNIQQHLLQGRLKDILATREHIPNKKEAKALRQDKAKQRK